nr:ESX secretion-associated protein EspG [Nocardia transvalensis]
MNVDAALLLQEMVGIDAYPLVLALMPNIYRHDDRDRVHAVVAEQLAEAGILVDGAVHPVVEHWLRCLYRPDVELIVRIIDTGLDGETEGMLRLSLVRSGQTHVLAVRHDDHVVIQSVFQEGEDLETLTAVLAAALGPCSPVRFEPVTASSQQITEIQEEVQADPERRKRALMEVGASPAAASVLDRAFGEVVRRAEVVMAEYRDGTDSKPDTCVTVLDTLSGRVVVTPRVAVDGAVWVTYSPGDDAALRSAIGALTELLPGRKWFGSSRTG